MRGNDDYTVLHAFCFFLVQLPGIDTAIELNHERWVESQDDLDVYPL
jgi:hypothetical protein